MNSEARGILGAQPQLDAEFAGNIRNSDGLGVPTKKTNERQNHGAGGGTVGGVGVCVAISSRIARFFAHVFTIPKIVMVVMTAPPMPEISPNISLAT